MEGDSKAGLCGHGAQGGHAADKAGHSGHVALDAGSL